MTGGTSSGAKGAQRRLIACWRHLPRPEGIDLRPRHHRVQLGRLQAAEKLDLLGGGAAAP